jgi:hypothetical protein
MIPAGSEDVTAMAGDFMGRATWTKRRECRQGRGPRRPTYPD